MFLQIEIGNGDEFIIDSESPIEIKSRENYDIIMGKCAAIDIISHDIIEVQPLKDFRVYCIKDAEYKKINQLGLNDLIIDYSDEKYYRVIESEWKEDNHDTEFHKYVMDWMNDESSSPHDLLNHGCQSGIVSDLIYSRDIHEVLRDYSRDVESIIENAIDESLISFDFFKDFNFDKLIWMCFESVVRDAMYTLNLDDI